MLREWRDDHKDPDLCEEYEINGVCFKCDAWVTKNWRESSSKAQDLYVKEEIRAAEIRAIVAWQWGEMIRLAAYMRGFGVKVEANTENYGDTQCASDFVDEIMGAR